MPDKTKGGAKPKAKKESNKARWERLDAELRDLLDKVAHTDYIVQGYDAQYDADSRCRKAYIKDTHDKLNKALSKQKDLHA
jgi:lipid II:glycine glycyltransferase (peptidoglycan interpeptide bridge formation enzyme)